MPVYSSIDKALNPDTLLLWVEGGGEKPHSNHQIHSASEERSPLFIVPDKMPIINLWYVSLISSRQLELQTQTVKEMISTKSKLLTFAYLWTLNHTKTPRLFGRPRLENWTGPLHSCHFPELTGAVFITTLCYRHRELHTCNTVEIQSVSLHAWFEGSHAGPAESRSRNDDDACTMIARGCCIVIEDTFFPGRGRSLRGWYIDSLIRVYHTEKALRLS